MTIQSVQSDTAVQTSSYWDNPLAPQAPHNHGGEVAGPHGEGPQVGSSDPIPLVSEEARPAVGDDVLDGTAAGTRQPSGRTPDGKEIRTSQLDQGEQVDITREQTIADAGFGRTYVSSDQVVLTTRGEGNDDVQVTQRDDGTLDLSVNGETRALKLGEGQELTIRTGAGNDVINVAPNVQVNIVVDAGAGDDTITTGAGDDRIDAGDGNDTVDAGEGRNDVFGGGGDDILTGGSGANIIYGGDGADRITAGSGSNYLDGGAGDDVIVGGGVHDMISAGTGNDRVTAGDGKSTIYAGEGEDTIDNAGAGAVVYAEVGDLVNAATGARPTVVNVEIDPTLGSSIQVEGSPAFVQRIQSELDMLRSSGVGQQMLAELDAAAENKGNVVTIRELANEQNGYAQTFSGDADIRNGRAGAGGDVTVSYNPSFHMDAFPAPSVVFYHELSHAFNGVTGTFQPGNYTGSGPDRGIPNAERQAVGLETSAPAFDFDGDPSTPPTTANPDHLTENGFREELQLPDRPSYAL